MRAILHTHPQRQEKKKIASEKQGRSLVMLGQSGANLTDPRRDWPQSSSRRLHWPASIPLTSNVPKRISVPPGAPVMQDPAVLTPVRGQNQTGSHATSSTCPTAAMKNPFFVRSHPLFYTTVQCLTAFIMQFILKRRYHRKDSTPGSPNVR